MTRWTYHCLPLWLLTLVGCHLLSSGEIDKTCEDLAGGCDGAFSADDTGRQPAQEITLSAVSPGYGHSSGGYSIILDGSGLEAITTVLIGGDEAEILSQGAFYVEVAAPARPPGLSDVAVTSEAGTSTRLANAFEYFQDADGAVQFVAELGVYMGEDLYGPSEFVAADGRWIEDDDVRAWEAYGASQADFDSGLLVACGSYTGLPGVAREGEFSDMAFDGGGYSLTLRSLEGASYDLPGFEASEFPVDEVLDLLPHDFTSSITVGIDRFAIAPGVSCDRNLSVCGPRYEGQPQLIPGNVEIRNLEPKDDDAHKIIVHGFIFDPDTFELVASISCVAIDRGYLRVDEEAWSYEGEWPEGGLVTLAVGRMRTQHSVIPHTNGTASVSITNYTLVHGIAGTLTEE